MKLIFDLGGDMLERANNLKKEAEERMERALKEYQILKKTEEENGYDIALKRCMRDEGFAHGVLYALRVLTKLSESDSSIKTIESLLKLNKAHVITNVDEEGYHHGLFKGLYKDKYDQLVIDVVLDKDINYNWWTDDNKSPSN